MEELLAFYGTWVTTSRFDVAQNCWNWQWSQFGGGAPDLAGWHLPVKHKDFIQIGNLDYTDALDEIQFMNTGLFNAKWTCTMDYHGIQTGFVQNWNNAGNGQLTDENLKGDVNYMTLKPLASDPVEMVLQIKNMIASKKFKCVLHRPSGTNKNNYVAPMLPNEDLVSNTNNGISAFPNPVSELLTVSGVTLGRKTKIKLFDLRGSLVYSDFISNEAAAHQIDMSNLENGIYLLSLDNNFTSSTFKIIKK